MKFCEDARSQVEAGGDLHTWKPWQGGGYQEIYTVLPWLLMNFHTWSRGHAGPQEAYNWLYQAKLKWLELRIIQNLSPWDMAYVCSRNVCTLIFGGDIIHSHGLMFHIYTDDKQGVILVKVNIIQA